MVNIIVIAHAEIANSFGYCAEHILARRVENLHIIPVKKTESCEDIIHRIKLLLKKLDSIEQSLILTDLYGATPCNISQKIARKGKVEIITGLNLAMLIRAISYANQDLETVSKKAYEGAISGIIHITGEENDK